MSEEFLYFIWQYQYFRVDELTCTEGRLLGIIRPGQRNLYSGPDFFNARVWVSGSLWAGNVEIHVNGADWYRHKHHEDPAFDNLVLHVVYENPVKTQTRSGREVPVLCLQDRISPEMISRYRNFEEVGKKISCAAYLRGIPEELVFLVRERAMIARLEVRTHEISGLLEYYHGHWETVCYEWIAGCFGFKVNAEPFRWLARALPYKLVQKYRHDLFRLEALCLGVAGLLPESPEEPYARAARKEFRYLLQKHALQSLPPGIWKFSGMRPANFPTVRIVQWAAFLHRSPGLLTAILEQKTFEEAQVSWMVEASEFWNTHYHFHHASAYQKKALGKSSAQILVVNASVLILFAYGYLHSREHYKTRALELLEKCPPETNRWIRQFTEQGLINRHAGHSQGYLQLIREQCIPKKCLTCGIGNAVLKQTGAI